MKKINTIHTSRTMMFSELEKVMAFSMEDDSFLESLGQNITGKKSSSGVEKTSNYLRRLYRFDLGYPPFIALKYFWKISDSSEKPFIAFLFAVTHDDLLAESIEVLHSVNVGDKASIDLFENVILKYHPNQYSVNTLRSMAQNIASSWKQIGFIEGKTKNLRTRPDLTYRVACFAFLLAYIQGDRGEFIWNNVGVKSLCLQEGELRAFALECAKKDLMQYQYAGSITAISFSNLLNKIGIHVNTN